MRRLVVGLMSLALVTSMVQTAGAQGAPESYIVVLKDSVSDPGAVAGEHSRRESIRISHIYRHALKGYAAQMSGQAASRLSSDDRVAYVERDGVVAAVATQSNATWGLDRTDQRDLPLNGTYVYNATGAGVTAYIIDTGIRFTHTDFGGRATSGYDSIDGGAADDCNGHGTHVAGTVGGSTWGIAKSVSLVAVRVLDCQGSGSISGVIAGVDWVTADHTGSNPAVANMSLGGGASSSLDTAVKNSIADGVTYGVAAGNGNIIGQAQNACNYSPARVPEALTVGATDKNDAKASWSNYGTCLDIFAAGVSITSAWHTSDTATDTISGTSMATPHVVGVAALYLEGNKSASPATVGNAIITNSTPNKVTSAGSGSPNRLLYSGFIGGDGGSTTPPSAPSGLSATAASSSQIDLSWTDNASDEDGFKIERSTDGSTFSQIATVGANATSYSSTGLSSSTTYYYRVRAYNSGGDSAYSNTASATTLSGQVTTIELTAVAGSKFRGNTPVDLSWSGANGSVTVFRNGSAIATVDGTSYRDQVKSGTWTYKVCETATSTNCSNEATVTT